MLLRLLRSRRGNMYPLAGAALVVLMIFLGSSEEYWRQHTLTNGVYNAVRSATEATIAKNAAVLYTGETDMAGNAYTYTGSGWVSDVDTSNITDTLANHLGLRQSGGDWVKYDGDGHEMWRMSDVSIQTANQFAPSGDPSTAQRLTITVTFTLKTSYWSGIVLPISVPMKVSAGIGGKF